MELADIRNKIDEIDSLIVRLLSEREKMVSAAGALKLNEQGVKDPERVRQVIEKVRAKAAEAGLDPNIAGEVYKTITACFVKKELREFAERMQKRDVSAADVTIRKVLDGDRDDIVSIFNYYVENGFAAYPDKPMDAGLFDFLKSIIYGEAFFVLETAERKVIGFGFLKKYHPYPAFNRTAEAGYFILPEHTGWGLGARLLKVLEKEARKMGIDNLLANISSLNPQSLAFHERQGFRECGRFGKILTKFGQDIDIVWMQKFI